MELKKYKLGDIAKIEISGVDKKSVDGETPVRLCNFVDVYRNWAITQKLSENFMIASAKETEIAKCSIHKGQVAITKDSETRDDIGIPAYIADDFDNVLLGYHCALITPNDDVLDGKYLNAFMHTRYIQKYFENNASGSGQRYTLSNETIFQIPILLPSLEVQKAIGNLLSNIDRKIELNRQINDNLEEQAKALFKSWFVDFEPFKGGKFVDSELGLIPKGWSTGTIYSYIDVIYGAPYKSALFNDKKQGLPLIRIRDLKTYTPQYYTKEVLPNTEYVECGDIIAGMDAEFIPHIWRGEKGVLNQRLCKFVPKYDYVSKYYIYSLVYPKLSLVSR